MKLLDYFKNKKPKYYILVEINYQDWYHDYWQEFNTTSNLNKLLKQYESLIEYFITTEDIYENEANTPISKRRTHSKDGKYRIKSLVNNIRTYAINLIDAWGRESNESYMQLLLREDDSAHLNLRISILPEGEEYGYDRDELTEHFEAKYDVDKNKFFED